MTMTSLSTHAVLHAHRTAQITPWQWRILFSTKIKYRISHPLYWLNSISLYVSLVCVMVYKCVQSDNSFPPEFFIHWEQFMQRENFSHYFHGLLAPYIETFYIFSKQYQLSTSGLQPPGLNLIPNNYTLIHTIYFSFSKSNIILLSLKLFSFWAFVLKISLEIL